jgi:DNA polymerase-1
MRIIIDSNGLAYRSLFSMGDLKHNQNKTGVIFGFLSEVRNLAEKFSCNQFIFCWDSKNSYRKLICPEYKENRSHLLSSEKEILEIAYKQFNLLRDEILPNMGFRNIFIQSGYEADDLIAWIVYRLPDNYLIATGDDDLLQLLKDHPKYPIEIYNLRVKKIITEEDFTKKYGIKPIDWSIVKSIGGCSSDNIKGISGVGQESAIKYLNNNLKDGAIKKKIESIEGKKITQDCMELVHLPFVGDREISIIKDREEFYKDDIFYSLNFMDTFKKYGCFSFVTEDGLNRWRKSFNLISGR